MSDIKLMALARAYTKEHFSYLEPAEQVRFQDGFISGYQFAKTEEKPHGNSRYTAGCRCDVCKEARRLSIKKWRAKKAQG